MNHDPRKALFAACRKLGIDEDARHELLQVITGKASTKDLTAREWMRVMDHLNKLTGHAAQDGKPASWRAGCEALGGKIGALLADQKLPWRYLTHGANGKPSMLKRLAGVDRLEFAESVGLRAIIAALAKRAAKQEA